MRRRDGVTDGAAPAAGNRWRLVAVMLAGAAWVVSLPPLSLWWAGPVSVALLAGGVRDRRAAVRLGLGVACGLVVFVTTLRWATLFTVPGYILLATTQATFVGVAALLVATRHCWWIVLPSALTLTEWLRHRWPLSGLPVSSLALGQADGPLRPLAALGGPPLITLVVAMVGCLLLVAVESRGRRRLSAGLTALSLVALASLVPAAPGTSAAGPSIHAVAVQGGGPRGLPAARGGTAGVLERHLTASEMIDGNVDLVLFPENVVDADGALLVGGGEPAAVSAVARRLGAVVVAGVVVDAPVRTDGNEDPTVRRFRNLAVVFEPDGSIGSSYDKVIRVPFGEYVPLRPVVDRIADLSLIPREAVAGRGAGILPSSLGRLGVLISFEGMYADRARDAVNAGATVLLVPTNAASYVTPDVPAQQVAAARLRAVETGRWLLLAGPTGPSALVGPDGALSGRSELEDQTVVDGQLRRRTGRTPYVVLGDTPTLAVVAIGLVGALVPGKRRWSDTSSRGEAPGTGR